VNPPGLLWWLGGIAVLAGILGLIGLLALAVDRWADRHAERRRGPDEEDE